MDDEKLILEVEKNEILYDKSNKMFKDTTRKQDIWNEIGEKLQCSGDTARKRWTNIRDAFHTYRKKMSTSKSGDAAKTIKKYKFADILMFLLPYLKHRETASNVPDIDDISVQMASEGEVSGGKCSRAWEEFEEASLATSTQQSKQIQIEPYFASTSSTSTQATSTPRKRIRPNASLEVDKSILDYLNKSRDKEEDENDHFFRSMAHSVKKLSSIKRAEVKFKIHQIVHDAEMEHLINN